MRKILALIIVALAVLSTQAVQAGPSAAVTRQIEITGKMKEGANTYTVRTIYRTRVVASIGDPSNPFGGLFAANPNEETWTVQICKASGCSLSPLTILCETKASGTITDGGGLITVDSTATACPLAFEATVNGYAIPKPIGAVSLVLETTAAFQPGATVYGRPATGSNGKAIRTLIGVSAQVLPG
ncbi:MAG: hypothetical protein ACLGH3_00745 [Actinomycetota bacterium]